MSGVANITNVQQLNNFHNALNKQSHLIFENPPSNWIEAFQRLIKHLEDAKADVKKVIFIDEMPWFDTYGSDFVSALEHFWNSWATMRKDVVLIACGSAASWMIKELINNKGGLHNRVTERMKIHPFTLAETEEFLKFKGIDLERIQIAQIYMTMGGIPYYLEMIEKGQSAAQNIQRLFFDKTAMLRNEYFNLYRSLFTSHELYEKLVETLSTRTMGLSRKEIVDKSGMSSGGTLTKMLLNLEESGFITSYTSLDNKSRNKHYRLSDFYTSFYFKFLKNDKFKGKDAWVKLIDNPMQNAWQGFTFEQLCIDHVELIKNALNIRGIYSEESSYRTVSQNGGVQIDLLIDRRDQIINVCEVKFSINPYSITKEYAVKLRNKIGIFKESSKTRKAVHLIMITTFGLVQNQYSGDLVQHEVVLDDLFVRI